MAGHYGEPIMSDSVVERQPVAESGHVWNWRQAVAKIGATTEVLRILRQLVAEIPWGHHLLVLNKDLHPTARLNYLQTTAKLGWSRKVLLNQIKAGAYERSLTEPKTQKLSGSDGSTNSGRWQRPPRGGCCQHPSIHPFTTIQLPIWSQPLIG